MSKIICDVCGTAFPENAAQCPICGSAKRKNPATDNSGNAATESGYKTVRGGRFSKRNVRKRNKEAARQNQVKANDGAQEEKKESKGLMILMFLLIGAVIAIFLYIVLRIFGPAMPSTPPTEPSGTTAPTGTVATDPTTVPTTEPTTAPTTVPTTDPTQPVDTTIPCESLVLNSPRIELNSIVRTVAVNVTAAPANTTDKITYSSSNKSVAIVDEYGNVSAIGDGNATIIISCGEYRVECIVTVSLSDVPTTPPTTAPTTAPTTPTTTAPTDPAVKKTYSISHKDVTIKAGETFNLTLRDSDGKTVSVNWKVTKSGYVNINGNKITGVKSINDSNFTVYVTIDGKTYSCIVRVK